MARFSRSTKTARLRSRSVLVMANSGARFSWVTSSGSGRGNDPRAEQFPRWHHLILKESTRAGKRPVRASGIFVHRIERGHAGRQSDPRRAPERGGRPGMTDEGASAAEAGMELSDPDQPPCPPPNQPPPAYRS